MKEKKITQEQIDEARKAVMDSLARYDELVREYLESKLKDKATE